MANDPDPAREEPRTGVPIVSRVFEKDAIRALKKSKYQPKVENGVAVERFGQTRRVEFKLPK